MGLDAGALSRIERGVRDPDRESRARLEDWLENGSGAPKRRRREPGLAKSVAELARRVERLEGKVLKKDYKEDAA